MDENNIDKLNRLQKIRVRSLEKKMLKEKLDYLSSCKKVEERAEEIDKITNEKKVLNKYITYDHVSESPIKREFVNVRKFWLNYDLEMHEYYENQERQNKNEAEELYNKRKQQWNKQKQKSESINKYNASKQNILRAIEENTEDEISQENSSFKRYH
jgi:hypothetical protein